MPHSELCLSALFVLAHATGIGLSLVGIVAVSAVSVLMPAPQDPAGNSFGAASVHTLFHKYRGTLQGAVTHGGASIEMELGVGLTLLSMFVLALQLILEEIVVGEGQLHPMEVSALPAAFHCFWTSTDIIRGRPAHACHLLSELARKMGPQATEVMQHSVVRRLKQ